MATKFFQDFTNLQKEIEADPEFQKLTEEEKRRVRERTSQEAKKLYSERLGKTGAAEPTPEGLTVAPESKQPELGPWESQFKEDLPILRGVTDQPGAIPPWGLAPGQKPPQSPTARPPGDVTAFAHSSMRIPSRLLSTIPGVAGPIVGALPGGAEAGTALSATAKDINELFGAAFPTGAPELKSKTISGMAEEVFADPRSIPTRILDFLPEQIGSMLPAVAAGQGLSKIAPTLPPGLAKWATPGVGAFLGAAPQEISEIGQSQVAKTGRLHSPVAALGFGSAAGALESLVPANVAKAIGHGSNSVTRQAIRRGLGDALVQILGKDIPRNAIEEGTTEFFQTILEKFGADWGKNGAEFEEFVAKLQKDPQRAFNESSLAKEALTATVGGIIAGGAFGGGPAAINAAAYSGSPQQVYDSFMDPNANPRERARAAEQWSAMSPNDKALAMFGVAIRSADTIISGEGGKDAQDAIADWWNLPPQFREATAAEYQSQMGGQPLPQELTTPPAPVAPAVGPSTPVADGNQPQPAPAAQQPQIQPVPQPKQRGPSQQTFGSILDQIKDKKAEGEKLDQENAARISGGLQGRQATLEAKPVEGAGGATAEGNRDLQAPATGQEVTAQQQATPAQPPSPRFSPFQENGIWRIMDNQGGKPMDFSASDQTAAENRAAQLNQEGGEPNAQGNRPGVPGVVQGPANIQAGPEPGRSGVADGYVAPGRPGGGTGAEGIGGGEAAGESTPVQTGAPGGIREDVVDVRQPTAPGPNAAAPEATRPTTPDANAPAGNVAYGQPTPEPQVQQPPAQETPSPEPVTPATTPESIGAAEKQIRDDARALSRFAFTKKWGSPESDESAVGVARKNLGIVGRASARKFWTQESQVEAPQEVPALPVQKTPAEKQPEQATTQAPSGRTEIPTSEFQKKAPIAQKLLSSQNKVATKKNVFTYADAQNLQAWLIHQRVISKKAMDERVDAFRELADLMETMAPNPKNSFSNQEAEIAKSEKSGKVTPKEAATLRAVLASLKKPANFNLRMMKGAEGMSTYKILTNALTLNDIDAFAHEIGHWAFYNVLTPKEQLHYLEYIRDRFYVKKDASPSSFMAVKTTDRGNERFVTNTLSNWSEYFAEQFRQYVHTKTLTDDQHKTLIGRIVGWIRELYQNLRNANLLDANMERFFQQIVGKQKIPETKPAPTKQGKATTMFTPRGQELKGHYGVFSQADLLTSDMPGYPQELQPRTERDISQESKAQIESIANNPRERELVTDSSSAGTGVPVVRMMEVDIDGVKQERPVVIGGNGRTTGIRLGYERGNMGRYKARIESVAETYGVDPSVDSPVFVRILDGKWTMPELEKLAKDLNAGEKLAQKATERAKSDTSAVFKHISKYDVGQTGKISAASNKEFLSSFFGDVTTPNERGEFIDEEGNLTQAGEKRVNAAIFAAAFNDRELIKLFAETTNPDVKNAINALTRAIPKQLQVKTGIKNGSMVDLDISPDLASAIKEFERMKAEGLTVDGWLGQGWMFDEPSDFTKDLVITLGENARSPAKLGRILDTYNDMIAMLRDPRQKTFDDQGPTPTKPELFLAALIAEETKNARETSLFADEELGGKESARTIPQFFGKSRGQEAIGGTSDRSEKAVGPSFYSPTRKVIDEKMPSRAPVSQVLKILEGGKSEEIDDLGLREWLNDAGDTVAKKAVLEYIDNGGPEIVEIVKAGQDAPVGYVVSYVDPDGVVQEELFYVQRDAILRADIIRKNAKNHNPQIRVESRAGVSGTKYEQFQLPGGTNYREVLLTMPDTSRGAEKSARMDEIEKELEYTSGMTEREISDLRQEYYKLAQNREDGGYDSPHFPEKNILAHIRLNDRIGPEGEKILFAEEIQSDWHQAGKRKGYAVKPDGKFHVYDTRKEAGSDPIASFETEKEAVEFIKSGDSGVRELYLDYTKAPGGYLQKADLVPNAPLKKSWPSFSLKKLIQIAVDQGYDAIGWTTGQQQADRYDLSKHIDTLEILKRTDDGPYSVFARKDDATVIKKTDLRAGDLEGVIGKELAEKAILQRIGHEIYSGLDLKVGGEGMIRFYDQILPSAVNKFLKKDSRVEMAEVPMTRDVDADPEIRETNPGADPDGWANNKFEVYDKKTDRPIDWFKTREDAERFVDELKGNAMAAIHFVRITPEVQKTVRKGLPLYSIEYLAAKWAKKGLTAAWKMAQRMASHGADFALFAHRAILDFGQGISSKLTQLWQDAVNHLRVMNRKAARNPQEIPGLAENSAASIVGPEENEPPIEPDEEEIEERRRWEEARGIKAKTRWQILKDAINKTWLSFRRKHVEIDPAVHAEALDLLRLMQEAGPTAREDALRTISAVTVDMTPQQYDDFVRNIALPDLIRDIENGLYTNDAGAFRELPFGFKSPARVKRALAQTQKAMAADPVIKNAVDTRANLISRVTKDLVENKILSESVLEDQRYYHHQVLKYYEDRMNQSTKTSPVEARLKKRGWQKARVGASEDYNTNYIQSEFEWLAQALLDLRMLDLQKRFQDLLDIKPALAAEARQANLDLTNSILNPDNDPDMDPFKPFKISIARANYQLGKMAAEGKMYTKGGIFSDILENLGESYQMYQAMKADFPEEPESWGRVGVDDPRWFQFLSHLMDNDLPGAEKAGSIFKAIADREKLIRETCGKKFKTFKSMMPDGMRTWQPVKGNRMYLVNVMMDNTIEKVLNGRADLDREDVKKQLRVMGGPNEEWVIPSEIADALDRLNDVAGEGPIDQAMRSAMSSWKQWILLNPLRFVKYNLNNMSGDIDAVLAGQPKIFGELWGAYNELREFFGGKRTSKKLLREMELGVIGSSMTQQDIPDIDKEGIFAFVSNEKGTLWDKYWETAKGISTFRENLLRLAAFRYYQKNSNELGASVAEDVVKIKDRDERAAKLARELLGDYGNISHAGEYIRRHLFPFWSWVEINAPRYARMLRNAHLESTRSGLSGLARVSSVGALKAGKAYAVFLASSSALYALITLWNRIMFPEEEKLLRKQRKQLHVILGKSDDGEIRSIRFQGALSDALGWLGLDSPLQDYEDIKEGKSTVQEKLGEAGADILGKFVNGSLPVAKTAFEISVKKSLYPDISRPAPIRDNYEHFARLFSLDMPYRAAIGRPSRGFAKETAASIFGIYSTDAGETAYNQVRQMASKFLQRNNYAVPSGDPTERSNALYYYKKAVRLGDKKAASKYLAEYKAAGGTHRDMARSVKKARPLGFVGPKYIREFMASLNQRDRELLKEAEDWYRKTYLGRK